MGRRPRMTKKNKKNENMGGSCLGPLSSCAHHPRVIQPVLASSQSHPMYFRFHGRPSQFHGEVPIFIDQNTVFEHLASSVVLPQQELLSTYLIPWCDGRGGRLRSETLSGGGQKSGNHKNNEIKHRKIIISTMSIRHAQIVDGTNNYYIYIL